jgi:hypothetical protein
MPDDELLNATRVQAGQIKEVEGGQRRDRKLWVKGEEFIG